jgi:undecaprenyl-diphosphatase
MTMGSTGEVEARQARPRLVAGAVAMAVSAVLVTVVAVLVRDQSGPVVRFDQRAVTTTTGWALRHEVLADAANVGGYLLHPFVFRIAVLVAAVWLWRSGARTAALWAATTMVVGTLLGALIKLGVSRARPVLDHPVSSASGYSFPSGHALNAMLGCTLIVVLLWRPAEKRRRRAALLVVATLIVLATGMDRLLLGVHFPSDVLAGFLVGGLVVASSWVAFGPILRQRALRGADRAVDEQASEPTPRRTT